MNIATNDKVDDFGFNDLFKPRSEEKEILHDSEMLMAAFLSEIEFAQEQENISRKELAKKISISASYLTQVFRHKKPLNFYTLAKMKRALGIKFEIKVAPTSEDAYKIESRYLSPLDFLKFPPIESDRLPISMTDFVHYPTKPTKYA